jgi:hypothetical protein
MAKMSLTLLSVALVALVTWGIISQQQRSRMVRRRTLSAFDDEMLKLERQQQLLGAQIEVSVTARADLLAERAEVLTRVMQASVELQRVLDDQRAQDKSLSYLYDEIVNATKALDKIRAEAAEACPERGRPASVELQAARQRVVDAQLALEAAAQRNTVPPPSTLATVDEAALAAEGEPTAADVTTPTVPATTAPSTTTLTTQELVRSKRVMRRRRKLVARGNSTHGNTTHVAPILGGTANRTNGTST